MIFKVDGGDRKPNLFQWNRSVKVQMISLFSRLKCCRPPKGEKTLEIGFGVACLKKEMIRHLLCQPRELQETPATGHKLCGLKWPSAPVPLPTLSFSHEAPARS
jgi:hypothetical protein